MRLRTNFIFVTVVAMTVLIGMGTTGRLASANDYPSCFAPGQEIYSATFSIYLQGQYSGQTVNLHRITAPWNEMGVTWNNFGGYDATVAASFTADGSGWKDVDVTLLVQAWINGTHENNGLLLDEPAQNGWTQYYSSEGSVNYRPKLEICFTELDCITIQRPESVNPDGVADSYIWELNPDANNGAWPTLYTGNYNNLGYIKQSLVRFEIPTCLWTRTPGFWKLHPDVIDDTGSCWNDGNSLLPIRVCNVDITQTAPGIPGATSEAMSVATHGWVTQLQLARQCTAAALNQKAMVANGGSYGEVVDQLIANCCGDGGVCGDFGAPRWQIRNCVNDLDDFNNSGDLVKNAPFEGCYSADSSESREAKTGNDITIFD